MTTTTSMQPHLSPIPTPEVGASIELFTGGGGLALAMHDAAFRHLLAVEWDKRACSTLLLNTAVPYDPDEAAPESLNAPWPLRSGDVRDVDFTGWQGQVDVVAGGVPCQPWSLGGAHKGVEDPRNLWPELFRCVRETRPRAVIAENVKGLLRPSFKPYYDYIIRELSAPFERRVENEEWQHHNTRLKNALKQPASDPTERYHVKFHLVNAADFGVPQIRWRVFVVAFRADLGRDDWEFPSSTHSEEELRRSLESGEYHERHRAARYAGGRVPEPERKENEPKPWRTLRDAIADLPTPVVGEEHPKWLHHYGWPGAREYPGHTPNELDRPAKTVKAGVHGVPGGETVVRLDDSSIRYMTVREVARVMTFPDHWRLAGPRGEQMRQLGNAVPVELGRVVADSVATALHPDLKIGSGTQESTNGTAVADRSS